MHTRNAATISAWAAGTVSALALLAAAPASAQAVDSEDAARERVDLIVVTARRREESLQDIPVSVSAFTESRIAELQADDLSGLQYSVPNFYFDEGDASNAVVYLRGVGQNDSLAFADAGVGVYVDDVFIARSQAAFLELFDVDRVEVLRGPQGTLYGRNTIGGAVKFISKAPGDTMEAYLEAGGGKFGFATVKGRVSGPLVEGQLRGKAAFAYSRRKGYNDNLFTGDDDGDQNSFSGRVGLYYTPTDTVDLALSFDGKIERPDSARSPSLTTPASGFDSDGNFVTFPVPDDPYTVNTNASGLSDIDAFGVSLKATWRASDALTFESISSYRSFDFDLNLDTDGTPLPLLDVLLLQEQSQFTQEIRATYDAGGPLAVTGGLYYFHDDDLTFSGVDNGSAALFGLPVTLFGFATSSLADTDQITDSYAAFIDATYSITDRLNVSAGVRYTLEEKESQRRFENYFDPSVSVINDTPPFLAGVGVPGTTITGEDDFEAFTPKFSISYAATDDVLLYGSVSRGFKSGGFDGRANTDFGFQPFDPEFVWSYEAGVKSSWSDGRFVANLSYFYNDYTDIQVTSFGADPITGVFVSLFTNAAAATIQGVEAELFAQPTDGLSLSAAVGYMDAQYDEFEILVGTEVQDVSDRPLVNTPEWSASMGATYEAPLGDRFVGVAHVDAAYRGAVANEVTASPNLNQDSYWLSNAFVALRTQDERWELRAGIRNIGDEAIRVQGFNLAAFPGLEDAFYAAPRTYDFRVILRY